MTVLNREEFAEKVLNSEFDPTETVDTWVVSASTVVAMVAMGHEGFSKDDIVEAVQALAIRMPAELVMAATMNLNMVGKRFDA